MKWITVLAACINLLSVLPLKAQTITVGQGDDCDYSIIQAA